MNKFAIYKSETGFYYYKYCDKLEQLNGSFLKFIVTEDKLPIVIDNSGGYFQFNENDHNFHELVETEKDCPLSLEKMYFKNHDDFKLGWMSPHGDTYSCNYTGHNKAAEMICAKYFPGTTLPERTLGNAGWLKIMDSWDGTERRHGQYVYSLRGTITKAQADKLFDIGLYYNDEVRPLIEASEDIW